MNDQPSDSVPVSNADDVGPSTNELGAAGRLSTPARRHPIAVGQPTIELQPDQTTATLTRRSDAHALRGYLQILAGARPAGRLFEIRYTTASGGMRQLFVPARRGDLAATAIVSLADDADVYIGVLLRTRRAGGRDAIDTSHLVFVEIDQTDATERLAAFAHAPTMTVTSGSPGHLHAYFALEHPIDPDALVRANRQLAHHLGGDLASVDATRVLRLPSSVNRKHSPPAPVTLTRLDRSLRYDIHELVDDLVDPPARPCPTAQSTARAGRVANGAIDKLLLAIPAGEYVKRLAGLDVSRTRKVACPFHPDQTPSLHCYQDGTFYCFGCARGGSIYDFAARTCGQCTQRPKRSASCATGSPPNCCPHDSFPFGT